jgi:hypothetical protein
MNRIEPKILPTRSVGRGTMRSMVEGSSNAGNYPSTTLRAVPLLKQSSGRIWMTTGTHA